MSSIPHSQTQSWWNRLESHHSSKKSVAHMPILSFFISGRVTIIASSLEIKNWILHFSSLGLKARNSVSGEPDTDCTFFTPSGFIPAGAAKLASVFLSLKGFILVFFFFVCVPIFRYFYKMLFAVRYFYLLNKFWKIALQFKTSLGITSNIWFMWLLK